MGALRFDVEVTNLRECDKIPQTGAGMAIYRLLQNSPLGPEDIARLAAAYEQTLRSLALKDRDDPITQLVATKIIEIGQTGIRDPEQLSKRAIKELGLP